MNNSRTIQTSQSPDLVTFKVLVEGEELSAVYQVKSISISKEVNRISKAQLMIFDGEAASQDFKLSNEDLFVPGKKIEIKAGYHNDEETVFKGIVIKHSIKIRDSVSALLIECRDEAVRMTVGRRSAYYYEKTDSDIIEDIIGQYTGLSADVQSTSTSYAELIQYQSSDWDFLLTRVQANGKLCFVDDGAVTVTDPDLGQEPVETVAFGATLLDFDGEIDARDQFSKITAYGWNPADQEYLEVEGNDPSIALNGNLQPADLAQVIEVENLQLKHGGQLTDVQLQGWSDATFKYQQLARTRGRIKFQGIPKVKPGVLLNLEGVGDRFNGKVYITGVKHELSDGNWFCHAQFGLNPEWISETFEISQKPASGLIPAISGLQIGVVTQLEGDPDGEDRILIKLPIINKDEEGIWARICTLDAGDTRGSFFRPEIEDEVIVGFLNDDPNYPVVLGMLNSSAKPAPLAASDDNHEKGFITRSGMEMIFNDDKASLTIKTPGGRTVIIDDDAGEIAIDDGGTNNMLLSSDGISMESSSDINIKSSGDINLEGTNVTVKANAEFKAEGSAGAEVSTSAVAVLKGSLVQIN
ncbi:MAG: type IV secretion protein Rhs [Cytophagaceae bacterium]|nr:type IV secretion protein Rhs [Cytophagaceae bacterium]|tara:strand:+ start:1194 stop:2942 length:1749 start_codon:yes stop_codon:yes gene_type:complete